MKHTTEIIFTSPGNSDEALINPGKGWILYDNGRGDFSAQSDLAWNYATLGYARFSWPISRKLIRNMTGHR